MCKTIELKCEVCGKEFNRKKKEHNRYLREGKTSIYCSSKCYIKRKNEDISVIRKCVRCEKEFESTNNKRYKKCCSIICAKTHAQTFVDINKISETLIRKYGNGEIVIHKKLNACIVCGKISVLNRNRTCSSECKDIKLKKNRESTNLKISETRKRLFSEGKLTVTGGTTTWKIYKNIKVQGSYELRTCVILDKMKSDNLILDWSYPKDRICYVGLDGKKHTYVLDFKVKLDEKTDYYIETKGYKKEVDSLKWEAVRSAGHTLDVWFISDIKSKEKTLGISKFTDREWNKIEKIS